MLVKAYAVAISLSVLCPATVVLRYPDGSSATRLQAWANASLVPVAPGTVTIQPAPCSAPAQNVLPGQNRSCITADGLTIYSPPGPSRRRDLMHELGHRFDAFVMAPWARNRFRALTHDSRPWGVPGVDGSPAELFADAYSLCARHRRITRAVIEGYGYWASPRRHRRVCRLIVSAAERGHAVL